MKELQLIDLYPHELKPLVLSGLKPFIGHTKLQVREYWEAFGVPEILITDGAWGDTREEYLIIMYSQIGRPEFEATFRRGLCVSQSVSLSGEDVSNCLEMIRGMGFSYCPQRMRWSKPGEPFVWRVEEFAGNNYSLTAHSVNPKVCKSVRKS